MACSYWSTDTWTQMEGAASKIYASKENELDFIKVFIDT
jgi:hypothetical protein